MVTSRPRTVLALLADAAARAPARTAIEDEHDALTYAELAARVASAAATLAAAGVGAGDRVAVWLPNSVAFVECWLAVLATGAATLPIGNAARATEMRRMLAETPVRALVAAPGTSGMPSGVTAFAPGPSGLTLAGDPAGPAREPSAPTAADPALVAYSSGTLARPHLVVRSHENLWWEAENLWSAIRLGPDDVVLGVVPLSHAHGLGNALLAALRGAARLVLRACFVRRDTLALLARERVTLFPGVPFMLRMLAATERRRRVDLDALRWCVSAGAPLTAEVARAFPARFGVPVRQLYGLTEAGSVTLNAAPAGDLDPLSVGTPLGSVRVTIEDAHGHPVPAEEAGEIVIRSPAAAGGAAQALRTRDRGRWTARGELVITGRSSVFINTAANKVDPAEVEAALRSHPAVGEVAVFGVPAPHGEQVVAAVVVRRSPVSADALRQHCRALLAAYKVPRLVTFKSALPRSPLGKVLIGRLIAER